MLPIERQKWKIDAEASGDEGRMHYGCPCFPLTGVVMVQITNKGRTHHRSKMMRRKLFAQHLFRLRARGYVSCFVNLLQQRLAHKAALTKLAIAQVHFSTH